MKQEIIKTKKAKMILQVYHNYFLYHKDMKSFADRKELTDWNKEIKSKSAYLKDGKLVLSKSDFTSEIHNSNLIVLNDLNHSSKLKNLKNSNYQQDLIESERNTYSQIRSPLKQVEYFNLDNSKKNFAIFQLRKVDDIIELHLLYDYFEIGEPERKNFKLCNLEIDVPVEIKINGKLDHSLSSRRERTYKEHCCIFHLAGQTNEFELERSPFRGSLKKIPKPLKVVDLMKQLY